MSTIVNAKLFIEEVQTLVKERARVIVELPHGTILAGVSGNGSSGKAVYDPKGEDIHAKREMLTRFWNAAKSNGVGLVLRFDLTEEIGCFVINAPTEEQITLLRTLEV